MVNRVPADFCSLHYSGFSGTQRFSGQMGPHANYQLRISESIRPMRQIGVLACQNDGFRASDLDLRNPPRGGRQGDLLEKLAVVEADFRRVFDPETRKKALFIDVAVAASCAKSFSDPIRMSELANETVCGGAL